MAAGQKLSKRAGKNIYALWWNRMFGRLVNLACSSKALLCWKRSQLGGHSENSRSKTIQRGASLERSAANVSIVSESCLYGSRWNSGLKQPFTILHRKKTMNSQGNYGSGVCWQPKYGNNKLKEFLFSNSSFFFLRCFPEKNMVQLMSSLRMSFNICFMFSHLGEEVKTSVAHQEPPCCWLDSHGIAGAVLRGFTQCQAAAVLISLLNFERNIEEGWGRMLETKWMVETSMPQKVWKPGCSHVESLFLLISNQSVLD